MSGFYIIDETINAPVEVVQDFKTFVKRFYYHKRFTSNLSFMILDPGQKYEDQTWRWNESLIPEFTKRYVRELLIANGETRSDEYVENLANETLELIKEGKA